VGIESDLENSVYTIEGRLAAKNVEQVTVIKTKPKETGHYQFSAHNSTAMWINEYISNGSIESTNYHGYFV
jgi:hypothetical protein